MQKFRIPLLVRGVTEGAGAPVVNAPVAVRAHYGPQGIPTRQSGGGLRGFSPVAPYTESGQVYNPDQGQPVAQQAAALAAGAQSSPLGQSGVDWNNPTTYSNIPLTAGNTAGGAVLTGNSKRNSLIIQNQSTATSPDVAPTFYIGFNQQPLVGGSLAIPPGFGFFWSASDCPPRDTIYIVQGPSSGASVVVLGCVVQGTYVVN